MLKKFALAVSSISSIFMVACSSDNVAGGTIDPNSIAEVSSSSESVPDVNPIVTSSSAGEKNVGGSSSSEAIEDSVAKSSSSQKSVLSSSSSSQVGPKNMSSSSIEDKDLVPDPIPVSSSSEEVDGRSSSSEYHNLRVHTEDFSLQCKDYSLYNKNDIPVVAPEIEPPSARFYMDGNSEVIQFGNVQFDVPCDEEQRTSFLNSVNESGAIVGLDGSTLYATFSRSKGLDYGCFCVADAGFKMDQFYPGLDSAVFDNQRAIPLGN